MIIDLTKDSFQHEVLEYKGKVLVDFWAPRCVPCKETEPHLISLEKELSNSGSNIKICRLNVDEHTIVAMHHGVLSIPYFLVFENGKMISYDGGFMTKEQLADLIR